MQYKRKHRLSAALMAGAMCCTMIPTASADEVATPETAETTATEAVSQSEQPVVLDGGLSVEELQSRMYPSLPQTATEYYLDSNGLPVLTGETKISIEGWGDEDYSDYDADSTIQVALDEALLNTDSATASFPRMDGEDYAIVPISIQVLYPANGGSADITLPDNVELLGYSFTSGDLCAATEEERQRQLHYDFSEVTASTVIRSISRRSSTRNTIASSFSFHSGCLRRSCKSPCFCSHHCVRFAVTPSSENGF